MAVAFAVPHQRAGQAAPALNSGERRCHSKQVALALAAEAQSAHPQQSWKLCLFGTCVALGVRDVRSRRPTKGVRQARRAYAGQTHNDKRHSVNHRFKRHAGVQCRSFFLAPPFGISQTATGHPLIGEELVDDDKSASDLADRCIEEAQSLLYSSEPWVEKLADEGVTVETCDVLGPYASSGVQLVRGVGEVDCSAEAFFEFQTSKLGFEATDEFLQNHRRVADYRWERPGASPTDPALQLNRVEWPYPMKTREFVSLDIIDPRTGIFVSKSCLHPQRPGGSKYQDTVALDESEFVRAVQYYAAVAEPISENRCRVRMVTWGEMCDNYSAFWVNEFNARLFIVPKFRRFRECMALKSTDDVEAHLKKVNGRQISSVAWDLLKLQPGLRSLLEQVLSGCNSDFVKSCSKARK